jgi:hypothetical protein
MCNYCRLLSCKPGESYTVKKTISPIKKNEFVSEVLTVVEMLENLYRIA